MQGIQTALLPISLTADAADLRQKTLKVGSVGRALAIFRVERVIIYDDSETRVKDLDKERELISTLLRYMETPQYLRKNIFPYMEELKYAGLLPPLRTPHHPLEEEKDEKGDFREAFVEESGERGSRLNIGLNEEGVFDGQLKEGSRITVELGRSLGEGKRKVRPVKKGKIREYWGYEVEYGGSLSQSLSKVKADYVIGTSRKGQNLYEALKGMKTNNNVAVAVVFGGPYQGLPEICNRQSADPKALFDVMVNTIPNQGVATVRTEEALTASLALLNVLIGRN
ncbi:MAG: putative RNA uridine N3 methyltransferase [Candidatus Hadarchaeia archaeon]